MEDIEKLQNQICKKEEEIRKLKEQINVAKINENHRKIWEELKRSNPSGWYKRNDDTACNFEEIYHFVDIEQCKDYSFFEEPGFICDCKIVRISKSDYAGTTVEKEKHTCYISRKMLIPVNKEEVIESLKCGFDFQLEMMKKI